MAESNIGGNYADFNSSYVEPAVDAAERPMFLAYEICSSIMLCKG